MKIVEVKSCYEQFSNYVWMWMTFNFLDTDLQLQRASCWTFWEESWDQSHGYGKEDQR